MNSELTPKAPDPDPNAAYAEAGQNYRKFLDWREKIVGGYVAIVGALGVGYHQSDGHPGFRAVLLCAGILTSLVFWILNVRNSKFIFVCVTAGKDLEKGGSGVYKSMDTLTHTGRLTHGLAVNLLVSGVVAGSIFGLWAGPVSWWKKEYLCPLGVCSTAFALFVFLAEKFGDPATAKPNAVDRAGGHSGPPTA